MNEKREKIKKYSEYIDIFDFKSSHTESNTDDSCLKIVLFLVLIFFTIIFTIVYLYRINHNISSLSDLQRDLAFYIILLCWLYVLIKFLLRLVSYLLCLVTYPFRYLKIRNRIKNWKCLSREMRILGCHVWNGNEEGLYLADEHDWKDCKCKSCGEIRDYEHDWNKRDKCKRCGRKLHDDDEDEGPSDVPPPRSEWYY